MSPSSHATAAKTTPPRTIVSSILSRWHHPTLLPQPHISSTHHTSSSSIPQSFTLEIQPITLSVTHNLQSLELNFQKRQYLPIPVSSASFPSGISATVKSHHGVLLGVRRVKEGGRQPPHQRAVQQLRWILEQGASAQHVPLLLHPRLLLLQ